MSKPGTNPISPMKKLIPWLLFFLISSLFIPESNGAIAPGSGNTLADDVRRMGEGSSPNGRNINDYIERALHKEAMGDFGGALIDYSTAVRMAPRSEAARCHRAALYSASGKFSEAIADLDAAIREIPSNPGPYLQRGDAHAEMAHVNAALADYDNAIRYAANTTEDNLIEAKAYYGKGDYSNAASLLAKAERRSPRDDATLNKVAWFKATCPDSSFRNGKEALQESTKGCELTKWRDAHLVDTLAAAYAEAGDFSQAIKHQMRALNLKPVPPEVLQGMQRRLRLYQAHQPFRDEPRLRKARS
jgi:serine/threonine-protein kinase